MKEIEVVSVQQHSHDQRHRRKCGQCDRVRLCTRCTLRTPDRTWEEWFCNECMTATPPWAS